jgi:hypothetical protein
MVRPPAKMVSLLDLSKIIRLAYPLLEPNTCSYSTNPSMSVIPTLTNITIDSPNPDSSFTMISFNDFTKPNLGFVMLSNPSQTAISPNQTMNAYLLNLLQRLIPSKPQH